MRQDFLVECRSYDRVLRGSWKAYRLAEDMQLGNESAEPEMLNACTRIWLPAGTPMQWATGTRPLRSNCLQFYWPDRWYMLSAFYNQDKLIHTYANIIQPARIEPDRLAYVDLDLSILVKPNLSYEVLTQVEFDQMAEQLHYTEETRISALMAQRFLTSTIQRSIGIFTTIPVELNSTEPHLAQCADK